MGTMVGNATWCDRDASELRKESFALVLTGGIFYGDNKFVKQDE